MRLHNTSALALLLGLACTLPAAAQTTPAGPQAQAARDNACWPALVSFDANKDGTLDAGELNPHREAVFKAVDRSGDGFLARDEYAACIGLIGQDQAGVEQTFATFDANRDDRIARDEFVAEGMLDRTKIVVQQQAPVVRVAQPAPTVRLNQAPPQVHVQQQQPTVTVQQQQPTITVQQPPPVVRVEQPPPVVRVEQPPPVVRVEQAKPEVVVEQAKPQVQVEQAQPRVTVDQAQPRVSVEQAQPKVQVQQAEARVEVQQAEAPSVVVDKDKPANFAADTDAQRTEAQRPADRTAVAPAGTGRDWETSQPIDTARLRVEEMIGKDVVNLRGGEIGEIEDIVLGRQDQAMYAIISVGGFLGLGDKDVAVPFDQLRVGADNMILMSQQTEEQLKQLPAYDKGQYTRYNR